MTVTIKLRRATSTEWNSINPVLRSGEPGYETDTKKLKIGDGSTVWTSLQYLGGGDGVAIDFEQIQDNLSTFFIAGSGISFNYDDGNDTLTINSTLGGTPFNITTVDLHNGGVQNAQVLQFTDANYQSVITGPTPASGINSQRIIIQGQRAQGSAEGGDVYLWGGDADTNGGDIKIYAGDADSNESGYGGYVNIDGGNGYDQGGNIGITAGNSTTQGGSITISAGSPSGNVMIRSDGGTHDWLFDSDGTLIIPQGKPINWGQNINTLGPPVAGGGTDRVRLWDFQGGGSNFNYAIGAEGNHVWFAMDVNNGTGGFKFYSRDNEIFKISDDSKLVFPNGTTVSQGTFDNSTGGGNGISLTCYVGYELNWQGGHLISTQDGGTTAANILCDSAVEFPGIGTDNVQIDSSGITFSDGTIQITAPTVTGIVAGTGIAISNSSGVYTINTNGEASVIKTTVFNKTGSIIPKFSAVYINGGQGDQPTIALAVASGEMTSSKTYGITAEQIDHMSTGSVIVIGALTGLNTDQFNPSAPTGDVNGTTLWLSPTTPGAVTTTKPSAPNHAVSLGTIVRTHQNQGVVEVRVQNGYELEELHNVAINNKLDNQVLLYNSGSGLWQNKTLDTSYISNFNTSVSGLIPPAFDAAVPWTINHTITDGTRYLVNDLVHVSGSLYKANYENESIPVTNTTYWTNVGPGYRLNIDGRDIPNIPYPVDNIIAGSGISVSSNNGQFTISATGVSSGSSSTTVVSLTYNSTLNTDANLGDIFDVTLTGNTNIANPTNATDGKTIRWRIKQDGSGNRLVTLGNKFVIPSSASDPLPWSTAANVMDLLAATYHAGREKWDIIAFVPGY